MQTKPKANSVLTHRLLPNGGLCFTVKGAGPVLEGAEEAEAVELFFAPTLASEANRQRAEQHGWIQRISDAAAISRDTKTGLPATPAQKLEAMQKLVEHYQSGTGDWKMTGGGGGAGSGSAAERGLLVKCLSVVYPQRTQEQLTEWVGKRSAQERAGLLSSEKIKPLADKFRAEQGSAVDADELLSEFEGGETEAA